MEFCSLGLHPELHFINQYAVIIKILTFKYNLIERKTWKGSRSTRSIGVDVERFRSYNASLCMTWELCNSALFSEILTPF